MWKVLFYFVVLVTVTKVASSHYTEDLLLENITDANSLDKIELLVDKSTYALNNFREIISRLLLAQPVTQLNLNKPKPCPPCTCGALGFNDRIIGGKEVEYARKYPWMALLLEDGRFTCGASLINDKYVLTAAHCLETLQENRYKVRLSVHNRHDTDDFKEYNVKRIITHEYYQDKPSVVNDIALIRLDTDGVKMSRDLHPVCMPKKGLSYANVVGVATGWGQMDYDDDVPPKVLREAELHVLSNIECWLYSAFWINQNMVCAGLIHEGKNACKGDSGGPLTVANGSVHHLIGIASFGVKGCRTPPTIFTRVSQYLDWIKANTEDACPCNSN